jgi:hypothetical protein
MYWRPPKPGPPFLVYLAILPSSLGGMLAQADAEGKERAVCFISQTKLDYEVRYTLIEKTCLAAVWAAQKFRHYLLAGPALIVARLDPLKYLFEKPGRMARWPLLLSEFEIKYVRRKAIKGQVLADHLAALPIAEGQPLPT